jgi:hypothetical protein
VLLRVGQQPGKIHWKTFLRTAVPLAAVVGLFTGANVLVAWLLLLPGSVMFAIYMYRRRWPALLRPFEGAKLGASIGLASFGFFAIVIAIKVVADPAEYRHMVAQAIQDALARNPTPEAQQMVQSLFSGTTGVVLISAMGMALVLAFLLVIGSVSGALAARFSRQKAL